MNISVGHKYMESNGNKGYFEPIELLQTISLKVEVKICKDENKRIIRANENYNKVNMQLMKSLY